MCPQKHTCSSKPVCVAHLRWLVDTPGGSDPAELLARALPGEAGREDAVF